MSWFSNLAKTYDRVESLLGINPHKDPYGEVLSPLNHWSKKANITVTISNEGQFVRAEETTEETLIPCTEKSLNRTSGIAPQPLHEDLSYLAFEESKRTAYLIQLKEWCNLHIKVLAVYKYISQNTLLADLNKSRIKSDDKKSFVRFRVEMPIDSGDKTPELWKDESVIKAWQTHCVHLENGEKGLCYVIGKVDFLANNHPKGINKSASNAKIVGCNDHTNYTYRGRFTKSEQANSISANTSHKAHAMLKYLIAVHGLKCGSQAIVAWAIDDGSPQVDIFDNSMDIFGKVTKTDTDKLLEAGGELDINYAKKLRMALLGMGDAKKLSKHDRTVAVIATDAATTGRMGITFYKNLPQSEFIERIISWHEDCSWLFRRNDGKGTYISAPAADRIIAVSFGETKGDGYQKIKKQARERLLSHIISGEPLNKSWVYAAVNRTSRPQAFDKLIDWEDTLSTTCAIVRKFHLQKKEEINLTLDTTNKDRNYLFGRLLAIADTIEFLARRDKLDTEKRPTNAIRYMTAFSSKPMRTWKLIIDQLNPYIKKLNGAVGYQNKIDEIITLFEDGEYSDKPLNGKYLLGYSLQRYSLKNSTKKDDDKHEPN